MPPAYVLSVHSTLGAMYIGMVLATSLHGISILQAWFYYRHQNDTRLLKTLVGAVMVCDTIHEALITHGVYIYTITNRDSPDKFFDLVRSLVLAVLFNGLTTLLVQIFMTMRLWRLSNHNMFILTFAVLIMLVQFGTSFAMTILAIQRRSLIDLLDLKPLSYAIIIAAAVGDILIAGAMCYVLRLSRTGFQRSDAMINKLVMFTVSTGLLTSLYAVASFIAYICSPASFINIAFSFGIGRLYTNALLATLNARKTIRGSSDFIHNIGTFPDTIDRVTLSLHELSAGAAGNQRDASDRIAIKINTTSLTDVMHDQDRDHDDKVARLQPSSSSLATGFERHSDNVLIMK